MPNHDWSQFNKRININATKEEIMNAWTSQENLERWFLSSAVFCEQQTEQKSSADQIATGDTYRWMWHGSDDVAEGDVLEFDGQDRLKFTFLGCDVDVAVTVEDGEQVVELTQSNIPLDEDSRMSLYAGYSRGWTFYLTNLKSILEGGIDLRNRNKNLVDVINT